MTDKEVMPMITPRAFIVSNLGKTVIAIISADYCDYETHKKNNACGLKCGECKTEAILNAFCEAGWVPPGVLERELTTAKIMMDSMIKRLEVLEAKEREAFQNGIEHAEAEFNFKVRPQLERAWKLKEADLLRKLNAILKTGNIDPVYETLEAHIAELEGK